eukprot:gene12302-biopygen557
MSGWCACLPPQALRSNLLLNRRSQVSAAVRYREHQHKRGCVWGGWEGQFIRRHNIGADSEPPREILAEERPRWETLVQLLRQLGT